MTTGKHNFHVYLSAMNDKHHDAAALLSRLPEENRGELLPAIRKEFLASEKTLVVLDDDPTGTQTCYDVTVLTAWNVSLLVEELKKKPSIIFILTNSRSVSSDRAIAMAREIGCNLIAATKESGRAIVTISRSDSTLRGHFPHEVDALAEALAIPHAVRVLIPAFIEGGRLTIDDIHYIRESEKLVPVAETPFAADKVFGYTHSNLKAWVEEKTAGSVRAADVVSISLDDIRVSGVDIVAHRLLSCGAGQVCVVNACSHKDLEVVVMALLKAEAAGRAFIYRTSATFVPLRAGLPAGKAYIPGPKETRSTHGSLVIVGSYVPKTTRQLRRLLHGSNAHSIEVDVPTVLRNDDHMDYVRHMVIEADRMLRDGRDVVIHTSRELQTASDVEGNLQINNTVSHFLVEVVASISTRPAFIIAKGGITSSDVATKALSTQRAMILGQIIPGVPVWKLDEASRFPGMIYVVFPGNVGDDNALTNVFHRLKS